jgi:thiol-disulfide isomerase/thioredoxin/outer membrane lipoprotein-sorting protein
MRIGPAIASVALTLFLLAVAGCGGPEVSSGETLLKASMDKYKSIKTYQADCAWLADFADGQEQVRATRQFSYQAPNLFKVTSNHSTGMTMTAVSDGKKLLELTKNGNREYQAPTTIATSSTTMMRHPMFCGTMLYRFFAGSEKLDTLVDKAKGEIQTAPDQTVDGKTLKVVKFTATDQFGTTEIGIEPDSKLVRFIRYHSEPLVEAASRELGKPTAKLVTTETYSNIKTDIDIPAELFAAKLPPGETLGGPPQDAPPVPLGQPAPDFTVTSMEGKKTTLSALKGSVVFVDLWATWCGPCKETLPHTQALHDKYAAKGLKVLAISNEPRETVEPFLKANKFTFPAYIDSESNAGRAYRSPGLPTFLIIDKKGVLVDYIIGAGDPSRIETALRKAGLKI